MFHGLVVGETAAEDGRVGTPRTTKANSGMLNLGVRNQTRL